MTYILIIGNMHGDFFYTLLSLVICIVIFKWIDKMSKLIYKIYNLPKIEIKNFSKPRNLHKIIHLVISFRSGNCKYSLGINFNIPIT